MTEKPAEYGGSLVENVIFTVRGQKVILDANLARIYGVATRVLNQAVKRNHEKFPPDFMFQLTAQEVTDLKSQFGTSRSGGNRSQIVTGSQKHRDPRYLPYVFTEHGAIMAATVLNSRQAVQMSVFVVRAFVKMREQLLNRAELEKRLAVIENALLSHDETLRDLYQKLRPLLLPPPDPPRKRIGFGVREKRAEYKAQGKRP